MLWIGNAKDPFTGQVFTWKLDAGSAKSAMDVFLSTIITHNPFFAACAELWVKPADENDKTFAVFCRNAAHPELNRNYYPDSFKEATDISDAMSAFYDDVEICFGWEGSWTHYDMDDVGMRLYSQYYTEVG